MSEAPHLSIAPAPPTSSAKTGHETPPSPRTACGSGSPAASLSDYVPPIRKNYPSPLSVPSPIPPARSSPAAPPLTSAALYTLPALQSPPSPGPAIASGPPSHCPSAAAVPAARYGAAACTPAIVPSDNPVTPLSPTLAPLPHTPPAPSPLPHCPWQAPPHLLLMHDLAAPSPLPPTLSGTPGSSPGHPSSL